jgi:hypothetical protein
LEGWEGTGSLERDRLFLWKVGKGRMGRDRLLGMGRDRLLGVGSEELAL